MEERQKNTPTPDSTTAFERQRKRKVILVAAVGSCLVIGFIWFLFKPAPTIGEGQAGINTTLPDGKAPKIEGDKRSIKVANLYDAVFCAQKSARHSAKA